MSNQLYCLKCRQKTQSNNLKVIDLAIQYKKGPKAGQTANKPAIEGYCNICNTRKIQFVKSHAEGKGILGNLLGLPGGQVPILSSIPLLGALF